MNKNQLTKLKESVEAWNAWRTAEANTEVNLQGADLKGAELENIILKDANLKGANLKGAYLYGANLQGANLQGAELASANLQNTTFQDANLEAADLWDANLQGANIQGANLLYANLQIADLQNANLKGADLKDTKLQDANLQDANLQGANLVSTSLEGASLEGADLTNAIIVETTFGNTSLFGTIGLDSCQHDGPSTIDHRTLERSGELPLVFLQGCGLPNLLIEFLPKLFNQPIQFYSCFISYSHTDIVFARRLHDQLQGKGIRCWRDEHQMLFGDDIHDQVDRNIKLYDKVLLCCSESSLTSWWVDNEINTAFKKEQNLLKERTKKVLSLIPLNLDGYLFKWEDGKADQVRSRLAADFTGWEKDNDKFEAAFELLVKALKTENRGREPAPKSML